MRLRLTVLGCMLIMLCRGQTVSFTNTVVMTTDASSYDTPVYVLYMTYLNGMITCMNNGRTNYIYSISRGGASWQNQFESQQYPYALPIWCFGYYSNGVVSYDIMMPNDNGAYLSNNIIQWGTNLFNAPTNMWDGHSITNTGFSFPVKHVSTGANINQTADGDNGALSRNNGSIALDTMYGAPVMDLWHDNYTNGINHDLATVCPVGGTNFFNAAGHPAPKTALGMGIATYRQLFSDTNVGSMVINYGGATVSSSNKMAATGLTVTENTLSMTWKPDRWAPPWDIAPSISNEVAQLIFADCPTYASVFQWTISITNLPAGTWALALNGTNIFVGTESQYTNLNLATNVFAGTQDPLWLKRFAVLASIRTMYGADATNGVPTHNGGNNPDGQPDLNTYQSNASAQFNTQHKVGATYVNAMGTWMVALANRSYSNYLAAQTIPFSLTLSNVSGTTTGMNSLSIGTLTVK